MEIKKVLFHKKMIMLSLLLLLATVGIYFKTQSETELTESRQLVLEQQEEYIASYGGYILEIVEKTEQMESISIFAGEDSYSNRNIKKTKSAFEKMENVKLMAGDYRGLSSVVEFDMAHYAILLFSIFVVWNFFEDEKKGLKCISYATPEGRGSLILRRIGTLIIGISVFVILLYGIIFSVAWGRYGSLENLSAPVQSAPEFMDCVFSFSVLEYIIWYVMIKIYMAVGVALFVWMMLSVFRNQVFSAGLLVVVVGIETVLSVILSEQNPLVGLKYINIFQIIRPGNLLYSYRNFNVWGRPLNCFWALIVLTGLLGIGSALVCIWIGIYRKPFHNRAKIELLLVGLGKKIRKGYHIVISRLGAVGMECYKIFIVQKSVFFVLIWGGLLLSFMDTNPVKYMGNNILMQEIYNEYSGPLDGRLEAYIEEEQEVLKQEEVAYEEAVEAYNRGELTQEEFEGKANYYSSFEPLSRCIENVSNQLEYLKALEEEKGIEGWFMDNRGYKFILTDDGLYTDAGFASQEKRALLCVALVVFLFCTVFSYDKSCGLERLIHSTKEGRQRLFNRKIGIVLCITMIIAIVAYGLELYEIDQVYSISCLNAPVQSLFAMKDFPFAINILTFLILLEMIHIILLSALSMIVLFFSLKIGGLKGMIISLLILCGPEVVKMLGISWAEKISLVQPFVYVEAYHKYGFVYSMIGVFVVLVLGIGSFLYLKKSGVNHVEKAT